MSAIPPASCRAAVTEQPSDGRLFLRVSTEGDRLIVWATGELDAASRDQLVIASTAGTHPLMVIDLAGVTFMDCSGFGSLAASRLVVERDGRSLTTRGHTGQPERLLELIAALEDQPAP